MVKMISETPEKLKQMQKEDDRLVKGTFQCHNPKGGNIEFSYRKYKGAVQNFKLFDGQVYELPVGVVKHLRSCGRNIHSHILDADGKPTVGIGKKDYRFGFEVEL